MKLNKRIYKALVLIFTITFITNACTPQSKEISLTINTNFDDTYAVNINLQSNELNEGIDIELNKDGSFTWQTEADTPQWMQVSFYPIKRDRQLGATFPLYLKPGSDTNIDLTYADETYFTLLSDQLDGNNKTLINYSVFLNRQQRSLFFDADKGIENLINQYLTVADELIKENKVRDSGVKEYMKVWSYNSFLGATLDQQQVNNVTIPNDMLQTLSTDLIHTFYSGISNLSRYITVISAAQAGGNKLDQLENEIQHISKHITDQTLKDQLLSFKFGNFITSYTLVDFNTFEADLERFEALAEVINDTEIRETSINSLKNLTYTSVGSPMPNVTFKDIDGNDVSLEQFKGNHIYIDLWAAWCAPCLQEVPHFKKLEEDYKNKNIKFVSLSIDQDPKAWHDKIAELSLTGNQWTAIGSDFEEIMNVTGIPHFILYDAEGNLLIYKAPRPSSPEIRNIFDELDK